MLPEPPPAEPHDPARLRDLIVQHDQAQADAYFRPEPAGNVPAGPRADGDVQRLSSTLFEASLVSLAALLAARLLKGLD